MNIQYHREHELAFLERRQMDMTRFSRRTWLALSFLLIGSMAVIALAASPFEEWEQSAHANKELAVHEATVENRGPLTAHCARCHAQQGYALYAEQLKNGDPGWLKGPEGENASPDYMAEIGLNEADVEPVTCTACHQEGNFRLRFDGNTPMLAAGFAAQGVGSGAVCMTCHNTRNGRVTWDAEAANSHSAPHRSAQADVIMGKNAFFVNDVGDNASPHAAFAGDSCATCHLQLGTNGHAFEVGEDVCASCHGENLDIRYAQAPFGELLDSLKGAVATNALALTDQIATMNLWDPETDEFTETEVDGASFVKLDEILSIHGQSSFKFVDGDGNAFYSELRDIKNADGEPVYALDDPTVKATWNYLLVKYDGSMGVHNPAYAREVLIATMDALK